MTTKEAVLKALNKKKDTYVSGEALALTAGVSRTSIWKAVQSLEKMGYCIEASSNCGYRLISPPDNIDETAIASYFKNWHISCPHIKAFDSIDSTLNESKRLEATVNSFRLSDGNFTEEGKKLHRTLIVAGQQTAGRGRMGRTFISPANSGVYFTLIYAPKDGISNPALLTAAAAVAVVRSIKKLYALTAQIKWVNDIFANGKKICGILTEGVVSMERGLVEAANIGIGINLRPAGFSGQLSKVAGSLFEASGRNPDAAAISRNELAALVTAELLTIYDTWEEGGIKADQAAKVMLSEYRSHSLLIGKTVEIHPVAGTREDSYTARVIDIDDDASLIVKTNNGQTKKLHSGEVSLHSYDFAL